MHPIDENPLSKNLRELVVVDRLMRVSDRVEVVVEKDLLVSDVHFCLDPDLARYARELSFFVPGLGLELLDLVLLS